MEDKNITNKKLNIKLLIALGLLLILIIVTSLYLLSSSKKEEVVRIDSSREEEIVSSPDRINCLDINVCYKDYEEGSIDYYFLLDEKSIQLTLEDKQIYFDDQLVFESTNDITDINLLHLSDIIIIYQQGDEEGAVEDVAVAYDNNLNIIEINTYAITDLAGEMYFANNAHLDMASNDDSSIIVYDNIFLEDECRVYIRDNFTRIPVENICNETYLSLSEVILNSNYEEEDIVEQSYILNYEGNGVFTSKEVYDNEDALIISEYFIASELSLFIEIEEFKKLPEELKESSEYINVVGTKLNTYTSLNEELFQINLDGQDVSQVNTELQGLYNNNDKCSYYEDDKCSGFSYKYSYKIYENSRNLTVIVLEDYYGEEDNFSGLYDIYTFDIETGSRINYEEVFDSHKVATEIKEFYQYYYSQLSAEYHYGGQIRNVFYADENNTKLIYIPTLVNQYTDVLMDEYILLTIEEGN